MICTAGVFVFPLVMASAPVHISVIVASPVWSFTVGTVAAADILVECIFGEFYLLCGNFEQFFHGDLLSLYAIS